MIEEILKYTDEYDIVKFDYQDFDEEITNNVKNKFWFNNGIFLFNKHVVELVGGYKDWVIAADIELLERVYNFVKIKKIKESLFYKRQNNNDFKLNKDKKLKISYDKQIKKYKINENIKIDKIVDEKNIIQKFEEPTIKEPISILIAAWQTQNFIEECLDSIEKQTYFVDNNNYEILLGIDACQDTLNKVISIKNKYRNLHIFMMSENKGTYVTTNTLLDLVKFENIIIFGSDDIMKSTMISKIMYNKKDYDVVRFGFDDFKENINNAVKNNYMKAFGAIFYKKNVIDLAGGYRDWRCSGDFELLRRIENHVKIKEIDDSLFYIRSHPNSLSERNDTGLNTPLRKEYNKQVRSYKKNEDIKIDKVVNEYKKIEEKIIDKKENSEIPYKQNKKINVIISAYEAQDFIEECLDSIEAQTYKASKILLGIDGCKKTLQKAKEIRYKYSNLEIYYAKENEGTYIMSNTLAKFIPEDEYIQRFDADDVMDPNMLEKMSKSNNIAAISMHDGVLFVKKSLFTKVGGYRDWRCAADSDMIFRLTSIMNKDVERKPKLYFYREHDKQLTKMLNTNFDSDLRKKYIKIFENNKKSKNPDIYIEPVYNNSIKKIYNIFAAIPVNGRGELLPYTIKRLLYRCGVTKVYCMGDDDEDRKICELAGAEWIYQTNSPLGRKWNSGIKKAIESGINFDAFLFVGSSDWISENWLNTYMPYLEEYDMVGTTDCYYLDINSNGKRRLIHWGGYTNYRKGEAIGIGRIYSMKKLKELKGELFGDQLELSMDYSSMNNMLSIGGKIKSFISEEAKTLSISTNKWINKHLFENEKNSENSTEILDINEWLEKWFSEAFKIFKIDQVYLSESVENFRKELKEKYGFKNFYDKNKPVFIFGMHRWEDYNFALNHTSHKVIFWCGSDAMIITEPSTSKPDTLKILKEIKNVTHLAGSKFVSDDLKKHGIEHKFIPVTTATFDLPVCPRGDNIYFYYNEDAGDFYGMKYLDQIKKQTKLNIILALSNTYSRKELIEIYKKCFIGIRMTPHDGIPTTGCELGLMGRRIIHNGNQPNALNYKNIDDVIKLIKNEYEHRHEDNSQIAKNMRKFLDVGDSWLYV
jgi:glycosyltransferase involved in cell wall biosynthesis